MCTWNRIVTPWKSPRTVNTSLTPTCTRWRARCRPRVAFLGAAAPPPVDARRHDGAGTPDAGQATAPFVAGPMPVHGPDAAGVHGSDGWRSWPGIYDVSRGWRMREKERMACTLDSPCAAQIGSAGGVSLYSAAYGICLPVAESSAALR